MEMTLKELLISLTLQLKLSSETASLDTQVLVANLLGKSRAWILGHPDYLISDSQQQKITQAMARLVNGEPLPYVIGHWEFFGREFILSPDVLIPRPETELLVELGIHWLRAHPERRRAVDVGTGSGCIGVSLAAAIQDLIMVMTDISGEALDIARINAQKHNVINRIELIQADLLEGVTGKYDLICANLPYIPTDLLTSLSVAKREPRLALDGGKDGLDLISELLKQAQHNLASGGVIFLEIEASQGEAVKKIAGDLFPVAHITVQKDLAGRDRCLKVECFSDLVHICESKAWKDALELRSFTDASLAHAGFIHCSTPKQVLQVANRFYQGVPDLVILWLDPARLNAQIRWEPADGDVFPHVYGPINLEAVFSVTELCCDEDGIFRTLHLPD
jgi:release factor glutamine methyltransferase